MSAQELLTFCIQRVVTIVPLLALRLLASLLGPGFGSLANMMMSASTGQISSLRDSEPYGNHGNDREMWAWFAAPAQPMLVGVCAWLGH